MKNQKLLTIAAIAGLTLGGFAATSVAGAESRGGDAETAAAVVVESDAQTDGDGVVESDAQTDGDGVVDSDAQTDGDGVVAIQEESEVDPDETDRSRPRRGGCDLDAAAEAIGIDEADLRASVEAGATIAEVAEADGVDVDAVIDTMVEAKAERLAAKVEQGRITQEDADAKLSDAESRITERVNGTDDNGAAADAEV